MDVKLNVQTARTRSPLFGSLILGSLALTISLGHCSQATAELVFASDDAEAETSTIFITDDAPVEPPQAPASVKGSVVFVEDAPVASPKPTVQKATAKFVSPSTPPVEPPARGDLKVVTPENEPTALLTAVRPLPQQQPLQPLPKSAIQQASNLEPIDEAELGAAPSQHNQPEDIQVAMHDEPIVASPPAAETVQPSAAPKPQPTTAAGMLIEAYKLSITAKVESEYTDIIQWCTEAMHHRLKGDQRAFASKLSAWALNRRGQLRAETGQQELANADFIAAIKFNPRNWRALHNRGVSHAQAGNFAEAFDDFSTVIGLNPQYAKAYANRATLYVQAKDLGSAIKDYQRAISQDENFATAHVGLGRVYHMLGEWQDALDHFSAAIAIEPNSPDIICSRGDLQADLGNYGDALADYARTIEIDPEFGHAYRNGAWLLATCPQAEFRDPENAVLGAQQALEYSYGERHVALDTLAAAFASAGQFAEAIDTVRQAADLAPEHEKFTYLSRLSLYQGNRPYRTEPVGNDVSQATYEASDR